MSRLVLTPDQQKQIEQLVERFIGKVEQNGNELTITLRGKTAKIPRTPAPSYNVNNTFY